MKRDELLRRLEERLARGEISERTYLDIKARYEGMPDEPEAPRPEASAEESAPEVPLAGVGRLIEETVAAALEGASAGLEAAIAQEAIGDAQREVEARMDEVRGRVREAMSHIGPRVEAGGRRVVIRGAGVFPGDVRTETFQAAGSTRVEGDLRAEEVRVAGRCVIGGSCECNEFETSGKADVGGNLAAKEFRSAGATNVAGSVRAREISVAGRCAIGGDVLDAKEVRIRGSCRVGGRVRTKEFVSKGSFEIGGGIDAKEVKVRLSGKSSTPSIRAEEVDIRRGERRSELVVGSIEAGQVYLEATRARIVRGREVRVGPFCTVDLVEADELEVHEASTVKERRPRAAA